MVVTRVTCARSPCSARSASSASFRSLISRLMVARAKCRSLPGSPAKNVLVHGDRFPSFEMAELHFSFPVAVPHDDWQHLLHHLSLVLTHDIVKYRGGARPLIPL